MDRNLLDAETAAQVDGLGPVVVIRRLVEEAQDQ
jgi:hypothetical protein